MKPVVEIDSVDVTSDFEPDNELASALEKYSEKMELELIKELGEFECDLEGRFNVIRTSETNLGNFVCDIMVAATNADLAILNSGVNLSAGFSIAQCEKCTQLWPRRVKIGLFRV